jgi:hypothetical protein
MPTALDRAALYYPYIHIRDLNWLKGTLLCFPQVRRVIPGGFHVLDDWDVREFCEIIGPTGEPLLINEYTDDFSMESPVGQAQQRLLRVLQDDEVFIRDKYSLVPPAVGVHEPTFSDPNASAYRIHTGKMMYELAEYLVKNSLASQTTKPGTYLEQYGEWVFVHESLGEAIMSTIAIAIARDKGLDIVTSDRLLHHALAVLDEDEVFARLVGIGKGDKDTTAAEKVDDLAEMVMTTCFDLDKLGAKEIGELARNGQDLRAFKTKILPIAESIPEIRNEDERETKLKAKTAEVIEEWKKYKKSLPRFALDALVDSTEIKFPEFATAILAGGTALTLNTGAGLAIGLLVWKGLGIWRKYNTHRSNPYSYLSKIEKAGASLVFAPGH